MGPSVAQIQAQKFVYLDGGRSSQVMGRLDQLLSGSNFLCGPQVTLADLLAYGDRAEFVVGGF